MDFAVLLLVEQSGPKIEALAQSLQASGVTAIYGIPAGDQDELNPNSPSVLVYLPVIPPHIGGTLGGKTGKRASIEFGLQAIFEREQSCKAIVLVAQRTRRAFQADDILAIGRAALTQPGCLVVGERKPYGQSSLLTRPAGAISRLLARIFLGVPLNDLRSGLLAIPAGAVQALACQTSQVQNPAAGEFELDLILAAKRCGFPIHGLFVHSGGEVGRAAGARLLLNSMSLYFVLARYISSSLLTALVDNLTFLFCFPLIHNLLVSIYLARLVAVLVNFFLLRQVVFISNDETRRTFPKYIAVVLLSGLAASFLINLFNAEFRTGVLLSKLMAELLLYFVNFAVLNRLVFFRRQE